MKRILTVFALLTLIGCETVAPQKEELSTIRDA